MSSAFAISDMANTVAGIGRPLCVLTLTPFFPSAQNAAQGCFVAEPIEWVQRLKVKVRTIAISPFHHPALDPCIDGSEWTKYYCLPGNIGLAASGDGVLRAIRKRVLDINRQSPISLVHAHAALPCGDAARALAQDLGIPFIVSVHGLDVFSERQAGKWLGHWTRRASLRVYEQAERIICISQRVLQLLPSNLHAKARVIYNGVDPEVFTSSDAVGARVLAVGNLIPSKGHATLLNAFSLVAKDVPQAELEVIGTGPEGPELARLAANLEISDRVSFRGQQSRPQVAAAMRRCSVFALPSFYEGLGCVYLEAMSCGKPTIACSGQGIEEIIRSGRNGVLIPPGDEQALAEAFVALLRDPSLRNRLGMAARQTIVQGHSLQHQAAQLTALYRECAG